MGREEGGAAIHKFTRLPAYSGPLSRQTPSRSSCSSSRCRWKTKAAGRSGSLLLRLALAALASCFLRLDTRRGLGFLGGCTWRQPEQESPNGFQEQIGQKKSSATSPSGAAWQHQQRQQRHRRQAMGEQPAGAGFLAATALAAVLLLTTCPTPAEAAKFKKVDENNWEPAPDLVAEMPPPLAPEEALRRHTTPSAEVVKEPWFRSGFLTYKGTCFGCHMMDPVASASIRTQLGEKGKLTKELLESTGYDDPKKLQFIIRYGREPKMPGYAGDCSDYSPISRCNFGAPLSEQQLADLQDFVYNRANDGWQPLPSFSVRGGR